MWRYHGLGPWYLHLLIQYQLAYSYARFLTIPTLHLPKNSIDLNKLNVYTPDTEYACSFFAHFCGHFVKYHGQTLIPPLISHLEVTICDRN